MDKASAEREQEPYVSFNIEAVERKRQLLACLSRVFTILITS